MLRLNTTAKDIDEDDQYSPFFQCSCCGCFDGCHWCGWCRYGWKEPLNVCAKTRMIWCRPLKTVPPDVKRPVHWWTVNLPVRIWSWGSCSKWPTSPRTVRFTFVVLLDTVSYTDLPRFLSIPFDSFRFLSVPCSLAVTTVGKLSLVDLAGEISVYYSLYYFSLHFSL